MNEDGNLPQAPQGGGGDRELISKEHALSDMRTLRHAIRQHWQIPADLYARLAARLTEIVETSTVPREIVAAAKVLNDFARGNDKFVLKGGAMPDKVMSSKDVAALASLPSREELLAKLLGTMQAPVAKFVRTLNEVPTAFVRVTAAVRDQKAAAA